MDQCTFARPQYKLTANLVPRSRAVVRDSAAWLRHGLRGETGSENMSERHKLRQVYSTNQPQSALTAFHLALERVGRSNTHVLIGSCQLNMRHGMICVFLKLATTSHRNLGLFQYNSVLYRVYKYAQN
jgi:hypothetical protein